MFTISGLIYVSSLEDVCACVCVCISSCSYKIMDYDLISSSVMVTLIGLVALWLTFCLWMSLRVDLLLWVFCKGST